jgi:hypothetical protein
MVKVGGAVNSFSHVFYYWTVAALLISGAIPTRWPRVCWLILGIAVTMGIFDQRRISSLLADLNPPWNDETSRGMSWFEEQKMVVRYLRAHPGEAYFPNNPLEHLAVEGRLPHFEYGVFDRVLAGLPLSLDHLQRHIPPGARRICYPAGYTHTDFFAAHSLKKFTRRVVVDELPGCVCFERPGPASLRQRDRSGATPATPLEAW